MFRNYALHKSFDKKTNEYRKRLYRRGLYDENVHQMIAQKNSLIKSKLKDSNKYFKRFIYSRSNGIGKIRDALIRCRKMAEARRVSSRIYHEEIRLLYQYFGEKLESFFIIQKNLWKNLSKIIIQETFKKPKNKKTKYRGNEGNFSSSKFFSVKILNCYKATKSQFYQKTVSYSMLIRLVSLLHWKYFRKK